MPTEAVDELSRPTCDNGPMLSAASKSINMNLLADNDDTRSKLNLYLHQLAGHTDDCLNVVDMEHSYSRPWNWRPENMYAKPMKTMFMNKCQAERTSSDAVDTESELKHPALPYDGAKARVLMEECEKQVGYLRPNTDWGDGTDMDWEERIDKTLWTPGELRLFNKVIRILNSDRLSRLTYKGHWNEPVMRRITVDKSARRFRQAMSLVDWDVDTIQWLHCLLIEHLSAPYLAAYFDIIQTLKSKIPQLVDRMINVPPSSIGRSAQAIIETLNQLVKRPWDPANLSFSQQRSRKLPGGPLIVMVPCAPGPGFTSNSRPHHWLTYLSPIGTLISIVPAPGVINGKTSISICLEQLVTLTRSKIAELRSDYPGRAIILVGLYSGAPLACQIALVETVTAVVCLGFPLYSVDDKRGQPDDSILDLQVPVLFVIGQNSSLSSIEEIEDMREQMHTETGLVVVGGADDQLRMSKAKKMKEGVTQSMVDRCILDEVTDFLGGILMSPYVPNRQQSSQHLTFSDGRRMPLKFFERKRKLLDSRTTADTPHRPAKRGRKPKVLNAQQKPSVATTVDNVRWTALTNGSISSPVTRPATVPSQVAVTMAVAANDSTSSGVGTQVGVASSSVAVSKPMGCSLTGLRLTPAIVGCDSSVSSGMGVAEVKLSIQGSVVRQATPTTSPTKSIVPTEGGSITVVAAAPAGPTTPHTITTSGSKDIGQSYTRKSNKARKKPIKSHKHNKPLNQ